MSVGEFTVGDIAADEERRADEAAAAKKSTIDLPKLQADVAAQLELAKLPAQLPAALEALLTLEKSSRAAEDVSATKACCAAVLTACHAAKEWALLNENIILLSKRRSQLKQVVSAFVRQAMSYVDGTPDQPTKIALITTLQTVTEGKIYVEIERARLTRKLAAYKEAEGKVSEAADILQEVAVETFGAMAKTEKVAFILEQVRLCLDKSDYIRAQILSRKVSPRTFVERKGEAKGEIGIEGTAIEAADEGVPSMPELKLRYYALMIRYHQHHSQYLEITRCCKALYEIDTVAADPAQWQPLLRKVAWFIVLSPSYSTAAGSASDRATLLATSLADKNLDSLPAYKLLLTSFNTSEVISWTLFQSMYGAEIASETEVFGGEKSAERLKDLQLRVVEHNVLVVAKYYTRIDTGRLALLLDVTPDQAEQHVSELVVSHAISAKIDRPANVVTFGKRQLPEERLNAWSGNIGKLLSLVEKSCQQIQKEVMVHKVRLGAAPVAA